MPPVSFATDIKPLFRPVDIAHMKPHGVKLDDYQYMSDPANNHQNAQRVQDTLSLQWRAAGNATGRAILDPRATGSFCKMEKRWLPAVIDAPDWESPQARTFTSTA